MFNAIVAFVREYPTFCGILFGLVALVVLLFFWYLKKPHIFQNVKNGFHVTFPATKFANDHKILWWLCGIKMGFIFFVIGIWAVLVKYGITTPDKRLPGYEILFFALIVSFVLGFITNYLFALCDISAMHYLFEAFDAKSMTLSESFRASLKSSWIACKFALLNYFMTIFKRGKSDSSQQGGSLIGLAWNVATFFIAPVITEERLSLRASIKRSAETMKNSFGHVVGFKMGQSLFLGIGFMVFMLSLFSLFMAAVLIGKQFGIRVRSFKPVFLCVLLILLCVGLIVSALHTITTWVFTAAAYNFTRGKNTGPFDAQFIRQSLVREDENFDNNL
jgi:hypothetical protein